MQSEECADELIVRIPCKSANRIYCQTPSFIYYKIMQAAVIYTHSIVTGGKTGEQTGGQTGGQAGGKTGGHTIYWMHNA